MCTHKCTFIQTYNLNKLAYTA